MPELKYKWRDLKGDVVAGGLNGSIFGLIYSFYFLPVDRLDAKVFTTCRNSRVLYTLMNVAKMAAGFAIMRSTYNGIRKQELGQTYEMVGCATAFGLICTFM
jgi:hypothetical protein